jgi:hypothetical protein
VFVLDAITFELELFLSACPDEFGLHRLSWRPDSLKLNQTAYSAPEREDGACRDSALVFSKFLSKGWGSESARYQLPPAGR